MQHDIRGLAIGAASAESARRFDEAIERYVKYKADAGQLVGQLAASDPEFALAQCLKGYFAMLSCKAANLGAAAAALEAARRGAAKASERERLHVEALAEWHSGRLSGAIRAWESILARHPFDLLALRMAHFNYFWSGEAAAMLDSVMRTAPAWSADIPGYGTWLAMRAFGQEEMGSYAEAERDGRSAVALDPSDLWATHAVAHVMEMQGRVADGVGFLDAQERYWTGANNMAHHLAWHRALYHLELGGLDETLALYDNKVRALDSPLVKAQPDLYIDLQNAASLLWRLEHLGARVGGRWEELADKAEARIGDHQQLFTVPHLMMALAAAGRWQAAERMLEAMRADAAAGTVEQAAILGRVGVPLAEAVIAHRKGEHERVVRLIEPIRDRFWQLGASHAQRDLFDQLFADSAAKIGRDDALTALMPKLAERRGRRPAERKAYAGIAALAG
jgi:tetratricopeptide (TPR) repeat protein